MEQFSLSNSQEEMLIRSTKVKMEEMKRENEHYKSLILRVSKDYERLIMRIKDIKARQDTAERSHISSPNDHDQLVSLTLGRSSSNPQQEDHDNNEKKSRNEQGPDLGLECKFDFGRQGDELSLSNNKYVRMDKRRRSCDVEGKKKEIWPTAMADKDIKGVRSRKDCEEEESTTTQLKKARVSIKARCAAPMINDGCPWRKYGQKIAKGNPCPRAYYRCTISPSCPVRKQVQRSAEDKSILITTYEGTHNHPLPPSATAMAFTTSAAAAHLLSGPSFSLSDTLTTISGLHSSNPNFYTTNPTCVATHNPYFSHPTITIDLTTTPSSLLPPHNLAGFPCNKTIEESHSQPFCINQPDMQQDNCVSGVSLADEPKSNPNHEILAAAISSNPSFQSVLADAIASYVANKGGG